MKSRLTYQIGLLCSVQFVLLGYFYSEPTSRVLNGWLYLLIVVVNSLSLTWLAYRAFQAQYSMLGIVSAVLAFPGLFMGAVVLFLLGSSR